MKNNKLNGEVELIDEKTVYHGFFSVKELTLRHTLFRGGWSKRIKREVVSSTRAVGVLLFDPEANSLLMVEQFRPAVYIAGEPAWMMEIVAGLVDDGEALEETAHREVFEETGCQVQQLLPIVDYYSSAGGSSEKIKLYCGLFSSDGSNGRLSGMSEEGEDIRTSLIAAETAFADLQAGKINNGSAIIALQWLQMNHAQLLSTLSRDNTLSI